MEINRTLLIEKLFTFSQEGSGIIIGKPGIGKSFALSQLSDMLWDKKIPAYIIKVDETDGTDDAFSMEVSTKGNWINKLIKIHLPRKNVKAVLIIDAFDAARNNDLRLAYLRQIRKAIDGLSEKWNIIVSVRTYDATKSPQLLKLFISNNQSAFASVTCRNIEVTELDDAELKSALSVNPILNKVYKSASNELQNILKIPFFLQLMEKVLKAYSTKDYLNRINLIKSETELLDMFWEMKVINTENSYERESLLKKLSSCLVSNKTLSILKDDFIRGETFIELRSEDLIDEVGINKNNIAFSHNILFDYAVSKLNIPEQPEGLLEFISTDKSRQFFLRPSFIYYFTRLWYYYREDFWKNYLYFKSNSDSHITLFQRLIPTSVIANEYEKVNDINKIIEDIPSTQKLLQSIRFLKTRKLGVRDIELLNTLSEKLNEGFLWEFAFVFEMILKSNEFNPKDQNGEVWQKCGIIARNFLSYVLSKRSANVQNKQLFDRLGSTKGIDFITLTFATDLARSKQLIRQVLELLYEPKFDIWYFSHLSDCIQNFVKDDPDFVAEIYEKIFSYREESDDTTNMGSVTMNLLSNRRQDYEMCYYRLINQFPNFLRIAPNVAIKTGLDIVNNYVIQEKLYTIIGDVTYQMLLLNGVKRDYLHDSSSMWHDMIGYHQQAQLETKIIDYFKELITLKDFKKLTETLLVYVSNAKVGFTWKKLIELGNQYPDILMDYLFELILNKPILKSSDTTYEIGISIQKIYPNLKKKQRIAVEKSILALLKEKGENKHNSEVQVNRLLNCIPVELLVDAKAIKIVKEKEQIKNEPVFKSTWSSEPYTTDKWLQDQGIDLNEEENKKAYNLQRQLEAFNFKWLNHIPPKTEFEKYLPVGNELFDLIKGSDKYKEELKYSSLREVAGFYSNISKNTSELNKEIYLVAKEAIFYNLNIFTKNDEPYNQLKTANTPYSPTPRMEASNGLISLLKFNNDEDVFELIKKYLTDQNPIIRFNISKSIHLIWLKRPKDFWKLILERINNEMDSFTLSFIIRSITNKKIIDKNEKQINKAINIASKRLKDFEFGDSFRESFASLLLFLFDSRKNKVAEKIIYENINNEPFARVVVLKSFEFIDPKYHDNDYTGSDIHKVIFKLIHDIIIANLLILKKVDFSTVKEDSLETKRLSLIDFTIQRIYFSLDINERIRRRDELHPNEENKRAFYKKINAIISDVIENSQEIGGGIIIAHTAHYLIETLNGVLKFYPEVAESILQMVTKITQLSRGTNYPFDPSAIREVVTFTEGLFADHKELLQKDESLNNLVTLLNIYVEYGWTDALELLWKLDEAFK